MTNKKGFIENSICGLIITYNVNKIIFKVVDSIKNQVNKVLIIDNGSQKEETRNYLKKIKEKEKVTIIFNSENKGIAAALNQGAKYALKHNFKWLLTLDHDSVALPNMIEELLRGYYFLKKSQPKTKIGILAPIPYDYNVKKVLVSLNWPGNICETPMVITSGSLINLEIFKKGIFFNENFFIYYVDNEFCLRIRQKGYKIFLVKGAKLLHQEGKKETKRLIYRTVTYHGYTPLADYYIFRNGIYLLKNYSPPEKKLIIRRIIKDIIKILLYDKRRFKSLKFSWKGVLDGWRGRLGQLKE